MCPDIWRVIITFKGFKLTFIKGLRGLLKCLTERVSLAPPHAGHGKQYSISERVNKVLLFWLTLIFTLSGL